MTKPPLGSGGNFSSNLAHEVMELAGNWTYQSNAADFKVLMNNRIFKASQFVTPSTLPAMLLK